MPSTYVIWIAADMVARDLLIQAHPEFLEMRVSSCTAGTLIDQSGTEFPTEPEPSQVAGNNLILIGGNAPNPYVQKYFVDTGLITADVEKEIMQGLGVYAGGKRCIATIQRNGTTVTAIFGWNAIDTLNAMQDYVGGGQDLLTYAIPVIVGVGGVVLGYVLGKKT